MTDDKPTVATIHGPGKTLIQGDLAQINNDGSVTVIVDGKAHTGHLVDRDAKCCTHS